MLDYKGLVGKEKKKRNHTKEPTTKIQFEGLYKSEGQR